LHNENLDHYFMTADPFESDLIGQGKAGPGWSTTGYGIRVHTEALGVPAGAVRVCRFYGNRAVNGRTGQPYGPNSHVFILDGPECEAVKSDPGWIFESYPFFLFRPVDGLCAIGQDPVYRLYNNRFAQNDSNHRFTTIQSIYQQMRAAGWRGEGVVMCAPQYGG
jgi:serine protease